jgi:hypothetical protein
MNLLSRSPRTLSDLWTRKNRLPIGEFRHLVAESHNDSGALQMKIFTVDRPEGRTLSAVPWSQRGDPLSSKERFTRAQLSDAIAGISQPEE